MIVAPIYFAILLGTIGCFIVAGVVELLSRRWELSLVLRILEVAAGIVSVFAIPTRAWGLIPAMALNWTMVSISILIGVLALLSNYSSRKALSCVVLGSIVLAF